MDVHGHIISGDETGVHYLRHLDLEESRVLFDYAKKRGSANFETTVQGIRRNFTLTYNNYEYKVEARGPEHHGWL
jgi:hypothetical protein